MSRSVLLLAVFLAAGPIFAAPALAGVPRAPCVAFEEHAWLAASFAHGRPDVWRVSWLAAPSRAHLDLGVPVATGTEQAEPARRRPVAVEYSSGYAVRRSIHKWASVATLPLFAAEFAVGQSLYNNPSSSDAKRSAHGALAGGIAGLFAVNSVTGVWNLWEGRKDPNGRTRRVVHGILMLAADAGFVATGATAPEGGEEHRFRGVDTNGRARHRAVALTSMGTALGSYLMMLLWRD